MSRCAVAIGNGNVNVASAAPPRLPTDRCRCRCLAMAVRPLPLPPLTHIQLPAVTHTSKPLKRKKRGASDGLSSPFKRHTATATATRIHGVGAEAD